MKGITSSEIKRHILNFLLVTPEGRRSGGNLERAVDTQLKDISHDSVRYKYSDVAQEKSKTEKSEVI